MNIQPELPLVAVCLATYRRPRLLGALLESLAQLEAPAGCRLELRIVDNDEAASACEAVDSFSGSDQPFDQVRYFIEPEQNIAKARNAALEAGPADVVIFVDDDEVVDSNWLTELLKTWKATGADAVFGPVYGRCPLGAPGWMSRGRFFDKLVGPTGSRVDWRETRTSNTLVSGKWFAGPDALRFDSALGRSGGEDSDLFARMENRGAILVTCSEAGVAEDVPASRATFGWLWKRWYRNGLIYERIIASNPSAPHPLVRFLRRFGAMIWLALLGLPGLLRFRPETLFKGLFRLSLGLGGLVAWLRPQATERHVAYRAKAGVSATGPGEGNKLRVAFLSNIVSPYRRPVFEQLAATPGWDFRLFVDAENEFDREWKPALRGLPVKKVRSLSFKRTVRSYKPVPFTQVITLHLPFGLCADLLRFRPQVVISLELGFRTALAALYCALFRKRLVIWSYQSRVSATQGRWRIIFRRFLLSRAERVVGMGAQAREVLAGWGVPASRIIDAPNAADHVTLSRRLLAPGVEEEIDRIRSEFAAGRKLAIVVGRLIPLKGIEQIIEHWGTLPAETRSEWRLVLVGNGPLLDWVKSCGDPTVLHAGHVPPEEMALWYAAADLHIFPTCGDVWGLVVNEASACGTPTLCSVHAGCFDDLIRDREDGFAFDPVGSLAREQLLFALNHPVPDRIGRAAREKINSFTLDNLAQSFRTAAWAASGRDIPESSATVNYTVSGLIHP